MSNIPCFPSWQSTGTTAVTLPTCK